MSSAVLIAAVLVLIGIFAFLYWAGIFNDRAKVTTERPVALRAVENVDKKSEDGGEKHEEHEVDGKKDQEEDEEDEKEDEKEDQKDDQEEDQDYDQDKHQEDQNTKKRAAAPLQSYVPQFQGDAYKDARVGVRKMPQQIPVNNVQLHAPATFASLRPLSADKKNTFLPATEVIYARLRGEDPHGAPDQSLENAQRGHQEMTYLNQLNSRSPPMAMPAAFRLEKVVLPTAL